MTLFPRLYRTTYEQRYMNIAMPAAIECIFMNVLASADLIMVGSLGAVSIAAKQSIANESF